MKKKRLVISLFIIAVVFLLIGIFVSSINQTKQVEEQGLYSFIGSLDPVKIILNLFKFFAERIYINELAQDFNEKCGYGRCNYGCGYGVDGKIGYGYGYCYKYGENCELEKCVLCDPCGDNFDATKYEDDMNAFLNNDVSEISEGGIWNGLFNLFDKNSLIFRQGQNMLKAGECFDNNDCDSGKKEYCYFENSDTEYVTQYHNENIQTTIKVRKGEWASFEAGLTNTGKYAVSLALFAENLPSDVEVIFADYTNYIENNPNSIIWKDKLDFSKQTSIKPGQTKKLKGFIRAKGNYEIPKKVNIIRGGYQWDAPYKVWRAYKNKLEIILITKKGNCKTVVEEPPVPEPDTEENLPKSEIPKKSIEPHWVPFVGMRPKPKSTPKCTNPKELKKEPEQPKPPEVHPAEQPKPPEVPPAEQPKPPEVPPADKPPKLDNTLPTKPIIPDKKTPKATKKCCPEQVNFVGPVNGAVKTKDTFVGLVKTVQSLLYLEEKGFKEILNKRGSGANGRLNFSEFKNEFEKVHKLVFISTLVGGFKNAQGYTIKKNDMINGLLEPISRFRKWGFTANNERAIRFLLNKYMLSEFQYGSEIYIKTGPCDPSIKIIPRGKPIVKKSSWGFTQSVTPGAKINKPILALKNDAEKQALRKFFWYVMFDKGKDGDKQSAIEKIYSKYLNGMYDKYK